MFKAQKRFIAGAVCPKCQAMDTMALTKEHEVEIIASPALARSLYYTAEVDEEIPEELFAAVAQVLAFIFQLKFFSKNVTQGCIYLSNICADSSKGSIRSLIEYKVI